MKPNLFPTTLARVDLLPQLWKIQDQYGYLEEKALCQLADQMELSMVELEGVISFYHFFKRNPAGKYQIYVNNSIISELNGYQEIIAAFAENCQTTLGQTSEDGLFGLFSTSCIGLSDREPAALINWYPFTNLTVEKVKQIVQKLRKGAEVKDICDKIEENVYLTIPESKRVICRKYKLGTIVPKIKGLAPTDIINTIKEADLKGCGGAFFPTGWKWESCQEQEAEPKYIICNADEGEPGTFKDRALINNYPGLILEGMIIAGYAVGANQGIIYLRAEYRYLQEKLETAIAQLKRRGLLGKNILDIPGFDFDIKIFLGAGAYVCGEETALIESLEGKRGEPRIKQYFPVEKGYLGKPTVVNNVETFCTAARILELGATFFNKLGTPISNGTKMLSIAGDCKFPGIYEIEWGISISELIHFAGAKAPFFIQISGPSGECISLKEKNRKICLEDLGCGGSVMIFNSSRNLIQILKNYNAFFQMESCGICTPCRAGNQILQQKLEKLAKGVCRPADLNEIENWVNILKTASRCGLGKTAGNAIKMSIKKFPRYFSPYMWQSENELTTSFDLEKAVQLHESIQQARKNGKTN